MISGCQRYIVEVRDVGTFIRDARDARDARTRVRIYVCTYLRYMCVFKSLREQIEQVPLATLHFNPKNARVISMIWSSLKGKLDILCKYIFSI